eukprot:s658_g9.t1
MVSPSSAAALILSFKDISPSLSKFLLLSWFLESALAFAFPKAVAFAFPKALAFAFPKAVACAFPKALGFAFACLVAFFMTLFLFFGAMAAPDSRGAFSKAPVVYAFSKAFLLVSLDFQLCSLPFPKHFAYQSPRDSK